MQPSLSQLQVEWWWWAARWRRCRARGGGKLFFIRESLAMGVGGGKQYFEGWMIRLSYIDFICMLCFMHGMFCIVICNGLLQMVHMPHGDLKEGKEKENQEEEGKEGKQAFKEEEEENKGCLAFTTVALESSSTWQLMTLRGFQIIVRLFQGVVNMTCGSCHDWNCMGQLGLHLIEAAHHLCPWLTQRKMLCSMRLIWTRSLWASALSQGHVLWGAVLIMWQFILLLWFAVWVCRCVVVYGLQLDWLPPTNQALDTPWARIQGSWFLFWFWWQCGQVQEESCYKFKCHIEQPATWWSRNQEIGIQIINNDRWL